MSGFVKPDLNNSVFQRQLFALRPDHVVAVIHTLRKVSQLTWEQVYRDKGLHWEAIESRSRKDSTRVYSLRVTQKFRAVAYRDGEWMRCVSLHPDHDSAYEQ